MSLPVDRRHLAIALASFTVLFYEVLVTRILSAVLWYHWAFLSISLAMLGLGAPGVWFSLRRPGPAVVHRSLFAAALLLPASIAAMVNVGNAFGVYSALFCMACIALPMLSLGVAICVLLLQAPGPRIARMYGADLLGASLAALLLIPALDVIPTPRLGVLLGAVPLLAGWLNASPDRPLSRSLPLPLFLCALLLSTALFGPLELTRTKSYDEREVDPFLVKWTHTARLAFFRGMPFGAKQAAFGWGLGRKAPPVEIDQVWIEQDSSAGTPVTRFDGDIGKLSHLNHDVTSLPFQLLRPHAAAIIGTGGGRDILAARLSGTARVDAVEMNAHIVDIVSSTLRDFSGDVYHLAGVRPVVSEGRSFLTRTHRRYDLIQISLIDSWAATAAGAFSLTENNLYTLQAYRLFFSRLTPGGVISTSRWMKGWMSVEMVRLIGLIREALRREGVDDPSKHLAVAGAGMVGTVLASARPLDAQTLQRLERLCEKRGFDLFHPVPPGTVLEPDIATVVENGPREYADKGLDMRSPTDDRPFFFQALPVWNPVSRRTALAMGFNGDAVYSLQVLIVSLIAFALCLFFLPFVLARYMPRTGQFWRGSFYFAVLGLGFMFVEVPWLQRFILFLGHPSTAATVVLGAILLGAGLGSVTAMELGLGNLQRWGAAVALFVAAVNLGLPHLFETALGLPLLARVSITVALLAPTGYLLGMFFPLGMLRFGDHDKAWFWAMNGACGVVASVVSLALAMAFGFSAVAWAGAAFYLVAWSLLRGPAAVDTASPDAAAETDASPHSDISNPAASA